MAQATSPSMSLHDGQHHSHHNTPNIKSNPDVPIDPSIAASSPTYPGPYSPYGAPQGHDMAQYPGHPPQGYGHWPGQYGHPHGMPGGPYSSPGTGVSPGGAPATSGPPRPGQVCLSTLDDASDAYGTPRIPTRSRRCTRSFRFQERNSINDRVVDMKKSSACTNAGTRVVRKRMVLLIT
jgi:hypothetical protein